MNLHIIGFENTRGENNDIHDLLWRLDNQDGVCTVREGRVESPQLCEAMHFDLTMRSQRDIRMLCQQWVDEKPERDRKYRESEERYEAVKSAWDKWEAEHKIRFAIPSVDHFPEEIAVEGSIAIQFTLWDEETDQDDAEHYFYMDDPTWGDVLRFFDKSIGLTGDEHHCFLEGLYKVRDCEIGENKTLPIYNFSTGS